MREPGSDGVLSDNQLATLTSVLDHLIPASSDGRLPGAGELGLSHYICEHAAESLPIVVQGLAALDHIADGHGASGFSALPEKLRAEVLREMDTAEPAFLPTLLYYTYVGYYQDAGVVEALGLRPGPPFPAGYEVAPTDFSILDPVRRRPKLYRE
jgi:hypothetical protein